MDPDIADALRKLKPGTKVRLTIDGGEEISGTIAEDKGEGYVSLQDGDVQNSVEADLVEDLVIVRSTEGLE